MISTGKISFVACLRNIASLFAFSGIIRTTLGNAVQVHSRASSMQKFNLIIYAALQLYRHMKRKKP